MATTRPPQQQQLSRFYSFILCQQIAKIYFININWRTPVRIRKADFADSVQCDQIGRII